MIFSRKIVVRPPLLCFFIIKPLYKAIKSLFKMMIEPFSQERNEATLVRSGITAFPYVLPLAGYFLSVADTLLLVLLVCFCHPSVVHLPLGRTITASLTLIMLSLVVTLLANLVSSCLMFYSPWHTSFNVLLVMNRILLACNYWNAPLLSNPMRVLFNHRFSPFEFSERSESQLLFPTQS